MPAKRAVASIAAVLTLAGCANAVTGSGGSGSAVPTSSSPTSSTPTTTAPTTTAPTTTAPTSGVPTSSTPTSSSTSSSGSSGFPTTVDSLGILLLRGITSIKSAHLELLETATGTSVRGIGDETLSEGKVTSIDLTETVNTSTLRFIGIGAKFYAKLPDEIYQSQKPWVLLSAATTNTQLKSIYTSFQSSIQTSAGQTITTFVDAAGSVKLVGTEQFDGTTVGHYLIAVSIDKLPTTFAGKEALRQAGVTSIPVEIYVDAQGRTRKVTEHLVVGSTTVDVVVTLTRIDQPVTIDAPPADQVGTS